MSIDSTFKSFLKESNLYVGGKTRAEVKTIAGDNIIYKLSSNENLLGSSPKALEAIRKNIDLVHEYPDRSDIRLRNQLSEFYENSLTVDHFITGVSGSAILEMIISAFLNPDDEIIISNPCFKPYEMFSEKVGAKVIDVPLNENDFSINIEGVLEALTAQTKIIFITSPNNPTGSYIPELVLDQLINTIPDDVLIVLDEVYCHYADAENYMTAIKYVLNDKNLIGLNSLSKTMGLAGMRIGYAYSTPKIAEYIRRLYRPFMHNLLSLEAGIASLKDKEFLRETKELIFQEKIKFYAVFEELNIKYWETQANFVLIKPDVDALKLENDLLQKGIMVRGVTGFGAPGCIRITIGTQAANEAFFKALKEILS